MITRSSPPAVTGSAVIVGNLAKQFDRDTMTIIGALDTGAPKVVWSPHWPRLRYPMIWSGRWRGERWIARAQLPIVLLVSLGTVIVGRYQAILALYPDDLYLLVAYLVARLTRKPLYGYFHNTYLENHHDSKLAQWLQPRVFNYAKHIFVMSEGMERLYRENYPGLSISPLVHTFNDPMPPNEPPPPVHTPLRLCLSGTLNWASLDAGSRMAQMVREVEDVELDLLTGSPPNMVEKFGFVGPRITVGTVSRDELLPRLRQADILLLPHGFTSKWAQEEIQTIFPTKVIEYLLSGRPILAHLPGDCFLAEFLREHNCALLVDDPSVEALKHNLERLRCDESLRAELVSNALQTVRMFEAPRVAQHLRDIIARE
jgi:glycosyltransferase involved in cell wall biosynthesis